VRILDGQDGGRIKQRRQEADVLSPQAPGDEEDEEDGRRVEEGGESSAPLSNVVVARLAGDVARYLDEEKR